MKPEHFQKVLFNEKITTNVLDYPCAGPNPRAICNYYNFSSLQIVQSTKNWLRMRNETARRKILKILKKQTMKKSLKTTNIQKNNYK